MEKLVKCLFAIFIVAVVNGCSDKNGQDMPSVEISFESASIDINFGESKSIGLMYREKPSDAFVNYDFDSNPLLAKIVCEPKGIITVNKGIATAVSSGNVKVTASVKTGASAVLDVRAIKPSCALVFASPSDTLKEDVTVPCGLMISHDGGEYLPYDFSSDPYKVKFSSGSEEVAFVDGNGNICTRGTGCISLTASLFDGSISATKKVTVLRDTTYFRFMQFNILQATGEPEGHTWEQYRKQPCIKMLKDIDPDIITLEEARKSQCADLATYLPQYDQVKFPKDSIESNGGQRNAILFKSSKFELLSWGKYWFTVDGNKSSDRWGDNELTTPKMTIYAKLLHKESKRVLWVFGAHYFAKCQYEATRGKCVEMTRDRITEYTEVDDPVIFAGDLNILPNNPYLKQYFDDPGFLFNACKYAPESDGFGQRTSNDFTPEGQGGYVIDYIFYRNVGCKTYKVIVTDNGTYDYGTDFISDHYPLYSDMSICNKPEDWISE